MNKRILVYSDARQSDATRQIRLTGPLGGRGFELVDALQIFARRADAWDPLPEAVIVHRGIKRRCPVYPLVLAGARRRQVAVIYDVDDFLLCVHHEHPDRAVYQSRMLHTLKALLDADAVVASTPALAEQLSNFRAPVQVIPNELPPALWEGVCRRRAQSAGGRGFGPITVGYIGSKTHQPDLALVEEPLAALLERHRGRVRFSSVGVPSTARLRRQPAAEELLPAKSVRGDYVEFARFAVDLPIDVGIAPLCDTPFNCCKSDMKFQEYAALGIAGVYADLPPYRGTVRHGANGFLAGSPAEWLQCLDQLVGSPARRRRMALAAAEDVLAMWHASRAGQLWKEVIAEAQRCKRPEVTPANGPLAAVVEDVIDYQSGLERMLKRSLRYQVGKAFSRLLRKRAA